MIYLYTNIGSGSGWFNSGSRRLRLLGLKRREVDIRRRKSQSSGRMRRNFSDCFFMVLCRQVILRGGILYVS